MGNGYENVIKSFCDGGYVQSVWWCLMVVIVMGLLVSFRVVMDIYRNHMIYEKRVKNKKVRKQELLKEKVHVKRKKEKHVKLNQDLKAKEHVKVKKVKGKQHVEEKEHLEEEPHVKVQHKEHVNVKRLVKVLTQVV